MDDSQLSQLATELGALAAGTPGVVRVQARPGFGTVVRQALDGLTAVVGGGDADEASSAGAVGAAGATAAADAAGAAGVPGADGTAGAAGVPGGRSAPLVGIAVTRLEARVTLDIAVSDEAAGPRVAREVAERLLARLADETDLVEPTLDLRIVGVGSA